MSDDVLDAFGIDNDNSRDDLPGDDPGTGSAHVCDFIDDAGEVCGATWDTASKLNAHRMGKHKVKADGSPVSADGTSPRRSGAQQRRKAAGKAPRAKPAKQPGAPAAPDADRAAQYTSGIATLSMLAYLARVADDTDFAVLNAGAPGLGSALDEVGAVHPQVRVACDLILGGGAGGPYVHLLMASFAIAIPIMANHGILPAGLGQRFGQTMGIPVPEPAPDATPEDREAAAAALAEYERAMRERGEWTADDMTAAAEGTPPTVSADLAGRMMGTDGAVAVRAPDTGQTMREEPVDDDATAAELAAAARP